MHVFIVCFPVLAVAILVSVIRYTQTRNQARSWRLLAERNGLSYERGWWLELSSSRVFGPYRGRHVEIRTDPSYIFDYLFDKTHMAVNLHNRTNAFLRLHRGTLGRRMADQVRPKAITISGDARFDQSFIATSRPTQLVSSALALHSLRDRLLRVRDATAIELRHDRLTLERSGIEKDATYLQFLLDLMVDLAETVEQSMD
jgi:hypothetical protein